MMHGFTNRLAAEKSPYLLQHAHNPVDWHPWSNEAFEKARIEDKPIFLSIGYATCHWCHVMERESFENEEIARLMNKAFVCIKVDREERPDIDSIYMAVCQMMTGSGGWPLTIVMTPDRLPFFAATYIPSRTRLGCIGMEQLVPRILEAWNIRRAEIFESARQVAKELARQQAHGGGDLDPVLLQKGVVDLMDKYDARCGGFGLQPKFPTPHRLLFLLRHGTGNGVRAAEHTLEEMRKGGIFDQIGFGFHRYSTDRNWLVPHFEKMLYDQALLAIAYAEAYEKTGKPFYAGVVGEILAYILRDMTAPEGGFYSAEDADSEGEEGLFYIWSAREMQTVLEDDYEFAAKLWNVSERGNYRDETSGQATGKNIPHLKTLPDTGEMERISNLREKMFQAREKRIHPLKDTKILTDWNGLMIAACAKAARTLGNETYLRTAIKANAFIKSHMQRANGRLMHRYRDGHTAVPGHLEDYAFMIFGLLELHAATLDVRYLESALQYNDILFRLFWDAERGGYFMTAADAEELLVRPRNFHDGAVPSGNSVQMENLLRLARLTGSAEFENKAFDTGRAFGGMIEKSPSSFCYALLALGFAHAESVEIVVVGERGSDDTRQKLAAIDRIHLSGKVLLFKDPSETDRLARIAPFTKDMGMLKGKTTIYICRNFACERPVDSLEKLERLLRKQVTPRRNRS